MLPTDAAGRVLGRLASRVVTARPPYVAVIAEAEASLSDPDRAAAFVEAGGLDRLETAVESAAADGREELAERGREAKAALERRRGTAGG